MLMRFCRVLEEASEALPAERAAEKHLETTRWKAKIQAVTDANAKSQRIHAEAVKRREVDYQIAVRQQKATFDAKVRKLKADYARAGNDVVAKYNRALEDIRLFDVGKTVKLATNTANTPGGFPFCNYMKDWFMEGIRRPNARSDFAESKLPGAGATSDWDKIRNFAKTVGIYADQQQRSLRFYPTTKPDHPGPPPKDERPPLQLPPPPAPLPPLSPPPPPPEPAVVPKMPKIPLKPVTDDDILD